MQKRTQHHTAPPGEKTLYGIGLIKCNWLHVNVNVAWGGLPLGVVVTVFVSCTEDTGFDPRSGQLYIGATQSSQRRFSHCRDKLSISHWGLDYCPGLKSLPSKHVSSGPALGQCIRRHWSNVVRQHWPISGLHIGSALARYVLPELEQRWPIYGQVLAHCEFLPILSVSGQCWSDVGPIIVRNFQNGWQYVHNDEINY